jgi:hypothetical protein
VSKQHGDMQERGPAVEKNERGTPDCMLVSRL